MKGFSPVFKEDFVMMNYEEFKAVVKENFLRYLPEEYRDATVEIWPRQKVNRTLDALSVHKGDAPQVFPSIYVNEMYEHYQACGHLEAVLRGAARYYAREQDNVRDYELDLDMEHFRENVVMCLVNTEQNRELLAGVPNRGFHDLSVIYRWVVESTPDMVRSIIVSDKLANTMGISEEELFRCAKENTRRISPVTIMSIEDMFGSVPDGIDIPPELRVGMEEAKFIAENMWIISNRSGINGAVSMLYEENLHQLAKKLGDNLFILPSSINEVIAFPAGMADKDMELMTEMVHDINMEKLKLEERLSNSVYCYDRNTRKVTLAAESPEKTLDGREAELPLIQEDKRKR